MSILALLKLTIRIADINNVIIVINNALMISVTHY